MSARAEERRRFGRIRLDESVAAKLGETPVQIIELSLTGFLTAHTARLPPGKHNELVIDWHGRELRMLVHVIRTTIYRLAKTTSERTVYHTGLRIVATAGDSDRALRDMIAERVIRALEEQKANARGIPPLAAYTYQMGKGDRFRRCELIDGHWRKSETSRPDQPANGFTISADIDPAMVDLLCRTYEATDAEGRRLTQILAQLSISKSEGIPTRRYVP